MQQDYLQKVLIYLQQELPDYEGSLKLKEDRFVFSLPDTTAFQPYYDKVFKEVTACVERIRNREIDLEFSVWSAYQERDFKIIK